MHYHAIWPPRNLPRGNAKKLSTPFISAPGQTNYAREPIGRFIESSVANAGSAHGRVCPVL